MAQRKAADLEQDYVGAGYGGRLGFGQKPALIVVDMVMAYLDPEAAFYAGVEHELGNIINLVEAARKAAVPVIFTNVEYQPGSEKGAVFYRKVAALKIFDAGSPYGAFHPDLTPAPGERVITKQYPSAFFANSLAADLHKAGVDTVIVVGVTTSGCVRATAVDALQNEFIPVVVADACGDRDTRVQEANLFDLGHKYADVVSTAEVLKYFTSL